MCVQIEEQKLTQSQSAAAEVPLISSSNKKGKAKKDTAKPLPTQNGERDSLSINSGILQVTPLLNLFFLAASDLCLYKTTRVPFQAQLCEECERACPTQAVTLAVMWQCSIHVISMKYLSQAGPL